MGRPVPSTSAVLTVTHPDHTHTALIPAGRSPTGVATVNLNFGGAPAARSASEEARARHAELDQRSKVRGNQQRGGPQTVSLSPRVGRGGPSPMHGGGAHGGLHAGGSQTLTNLQHTVIGQGVRQPQMAATFTSGSAHPTPIFY